MNKLKLPILAFALAAPLLTAAHADVLPLTAQPNGLTLDYSGAQLDAPAGPCPDSFAGLNCNGYVVDFTATGDDATFSLPNNPHGDDIYAAVGPMPGAPIVFDQSKSGLLSVTGLHAGEGIRVFVIQPGPPTDRDDWKPVYVNPVQTPDPVSSVPEPSTFGLAGIGAGLCLLGGPFGRRAK